MNKKKTQIIVILNKCKFNFLNIFKLFYSKSNFMILIFLSLFFCSTFCIFCGYSDTILLINGESFGMDISNVMLISFTKFYKNIINTRSFSSTPIVKGDNSNEEKKSELKSNLELDSDVTSEWFSDADSDTTIKPSDIKTDFISDDEDIPDPSDPLFAARTLKEIYEKVNEWESEENLAQDKDQTPIESSSEILISDNIDLDTLNQEDRSDNNPPINTSNQSSIQINILDEVDVTVEENSQEQVQLQHQIYNKTIVHNTLETEDYIPQEASSNLLSEIPNKFDIINENLNSIKTLCSKMSNDIENRDDSIETKDIKSPLTTEEWIEYENLKKELVKTIYYGKDDLLEEVGGDNNHKEEVVDNFLDNIKTELEKQTGWSTLEIYQEFVNEIEEELEISETDTNKESNYKIIEDSQITSTSEMKYSELSEDDNNKNNKNDKNDPGNGSIGGPFSNINYNNSSNDTENGSINNQCQSANFTDKFIYILLNILEFIANIINEWIKMLI